MLIPLVIIHFIGIFDSTPGPVPCDRARGLESAPDFDSCRAASQMTVARWAGMAMGLSTLIPQRGIRYGEGPERNSREVRREHTQNLTGHFPGFESWDSLV